MQDNLHSIKWRHEVDIPLESVTLHVLETGPLGVNTVILICNRTNIAAIFDPGGNREEIFQVIKEKNLNVQYVIHTHGHFDHCLATDSLVSFLSESGMDHFEVCLHHDDQVVYDSIGKQGFAFGLMVKPPVTKITHHLKDNDELFVGEVRLEVIHTPGHSPGSCSFYIPKEGVILTGDTLFHMGVGRTDLPGGDMSVLKKSIFDRLLTLDGNTVVIPGHGEFTTLDREHRKNPFVRDWELI